MALAATVSLMVGGAPVLGSVVDLSRHPPVINSLNSDATILSGSSGSISGVLPPIAAAFVFRCVLGFHMSGCRPTICGLSSSRNSPDEPHCCSTERPGTWSSPGESTCLLGCSSCTVPQPGTQVLTSNMIRGGSTCAGFLFRKCVITVGGIPAKVTSSRSLSIQFEYPKLAPGEYKITCARGGLMSNAVSVTVLAQLASAGVSTGGPFGAKALFAQKSVALDQVCALQVHRRC
jgi:hypothetical protein